MFYKFFDNQSTNQRETEINPDAVCDKHHVVKQLQRPFIRKLDKLKVNTIWGADLANKQLINIIKELGLF